MLSLLLDELELLELELTEVLSLLLDELELLDELLLE